MIVMIKGIYLITGLLNYSSVEARLFRRVLIALWSLWLALLLSAACSAVLGSGWAGAGAGGARGSGDAHTQPRSGLGLLYKSWRVADQRGFLSDNKCRWSFRFKTSWIW